MNFSDELKKKQKNFLSVNHLFTSITISACAVLLFNGVGIKIINHTFNEKYWGNINEEYKNNHIYNDTIPDNTKINHLKNIAAEINTANFVTSDTNNEIYLNALKNKMLSDISFYKNKNYLPIDVKYRLSMVPIINEKELEEQGKFKALSNRLFKKFLPSLSLERQLVDFDHSYSSVFINKGVENSSIRKKPSDVVNCRVNLTHKPDGSMISFQFIESEDIKNISKDDLQKLSYKFNNYETEMYQELIMLHEYYHCLTETKFYEDKIKSLLFGFSDIPEQKELSEYLYNSISFREENKYNLSGYITSNLVTRNYEKYVDTLATIALINRYSSKDNKVSKETLNALNSTISDFYVYRLISHVTSPENTHNGYEIFNYLTKQHVIEEISKISSFEEINNLALKIMEESNAWRLMNNRALYFNENLISDPLTKIIKKVAILVNNNPKYLNKEHLLNTIITDVDSNTLHMDLFNAIIDPLLLRWQNNKNYKNDIELIVREKNIPLYDNFWNLSTQVFSELKLNGTIKSDMFVYEKIAAIVDYLQTNRIEIMKTEPNLDAFIKIFQAQYKSNLLYEKFVVSHTYQNSPETEKELLKKFGTYYFSYENLSKSIDDKKNVESIMPDQSIVLLKNLETQFFAYKHNIKSYSLSVPSDELVFKVASKINNPQEFDFDMPPALFINKKVDIKISNLLNSDKNKKLKMN